MGSNHLHIQVRVPACLLAIWARASYTDFEIVLALLQGPEV